MASRDNLHSHVVAWLKIILPLAALAILSTLFLVARGIETPDVLPYAQIDLKDRARNPQATEPTFGGVTENADKIALVAETARPLDADMTRVEMHDVTGRIDLASGSVIHVRSEDGLVDQPGDLARLTGKVVITTSSRWQMRTEALNAGMRVVWAETDGYVEGDGPLGRFNAGKMRLDLDADGKAHLLLTQRVKLVYVPRDETE